MIHRVGIERVRKFKQYSNTSKRLSYRRPRSTTPHSRRRLSERLCDFDYCSHGREREDDRVVASSADVRRQRQLAPLGPSCIAQYLPSKPQQFMPIRLLIE